VSKYYVKFTKSAQNVARYAREEAIRLKHGYIGMEHILLGLVKENTGLASQALKKLGINLTLVRETIEKMVKSLEEDTGTGEKKEKISNGPVFNTEAQEIVELAALEGYQLGKGYVGTEHLLMGLLRKGETAAQLFNQLDVEPEDVYVEISRLMGGKPEEGSDEHYQAHEGGAECLSCSQPAKNSRLDDFGIDLTALAAEDKLEPIMGRESELERMLQILCRRTKNNPCLVGEAGVGKTAIAEGLAQKIVRREVPEHLKDKRVVQLELFSLVAGTKHRGEFEERLQQLLEELRKDGNVIVFIDEIHTVIGAGAAEGAMDASNMLKPALSRGEMQAIGATTLSEYRKHIESDAALERRFQPINVEEPSEEDSIRILEGLRDRYQAHHGVEITDEALKAAVKHSSRYIQDRFLPDKAIDLVDEASALVRINQLTPSHTDNDLEKQLEKVKQEKEEAINHQNYEKAAQLRDQEEKLKATQSEKVYHSLEPDEGHEESLPKVTEDEIARVVSDWTGIPVQKLTEEEATTLLRLEEDLKHKVIGQQEAVQAVSRSIRRGRTGLQDPKRPTGTFMFLGPTGVGKTELARRLAETLFGDEQAMHRLDMSEYMEKHATARLIGAPPGYVGYDEGGQLTEKVRQQPYSVILLDEIEKAHPEVFNVLLQVLEDGRLTDGKGRTVNFRNTVIIMTSNVGAGHYNNQGSLGFRTGNEEDSYQDMKENMLENLRDTFRPEFLNRLDDIIVFRGLSKEDLEQIVYLMLQDLNHRVNQHGLELEVSDQVSELLAQEGYDPVYGARPLRRVIQKRLEDGLSEEMVSGRIQAGDTIEVDLEEDAEEDVEGKARLTFKRKRNQEEVSLCCPS